MASSSGRGHSWKTWLRRGTYSAIGLAALGYSGICGLMCSFQEQLLYVPRVGLEKTPADARLEYEALNLPTSDGETISAWFVPAEDSRGAVVFCHGNGGNIANRLGTIENLHELGLDVLIFDYHGYGDSSGQPGEHQTYDDAMTAWNWLTQTQGVAPDHVVVWGRSLGGGVAIWLASEVEPAGLVVESSFTSIPDVASEIYWWLPVRALVRHEYPSLERIPTVQTPVLVAHGQPDGIVPYEHGQALFEAAHEPKTFVELAGNHNEPGLSTEAYSDPLRSFLATVLPRP